MTDLRLTLSWLELGHYYDRFIQAGFNSWETIMEITEDDLQALDIDLGHRRKLQKEIANSRKLAQDTAFTTPGSINTQSPHQSLDAYSNEPTKRRYRRHPKPDPNAPERPYSAYVLFSNHIREELKNEYFSFTGISRQVGLRWQALSEVQKNYWNEQAAEPWKKHRSDTIAYQKTEDYRQYAKYLEEFKAAEASKTPETKQRAKQSPTAQKSRSQIPTPAFSGFGIGVSSGPTVMAPTSTRYPIVNFQGAKVPISPLPRDRDFRNAAAKGSLRQRSKQACDMCRQKKTKCDGERPTCGNCSEADIECQYADGKKDFQKKQTEGLLKKLDVYESLLRRFTDQVEEDDQQAIQEAINMHPVRADSPKDLVSRGSSRHSLSSQGEAGSEISGVGSMGDTDQVDHDNYNKALPENRTGAYLGQVSDMAWTQRLKSELGQDPKGQGRPQVRKGPEIDGDFGPSTDMSTVGDQVDPFQMPVKTTADMLFDVYFATVHPSFPIINKAEFTSKYNKLFNCMDNESFSDLIFLATLKLVFAISAIHAHVSGSEWAGDERDHILYFAQARLLAVDNGILDDVVYIEQVQVHALGALYFLATDQLNRSWNIIGLAIRCAQSLGLHLVDVSRSTSEEQKALYAHVWFAVVTFERQITMMTGRPSMVREQDCSIMLSQSLPDEDSSSAGSPLEYYQPGSARQLGNSATSHSVGDSSISEPTRASSQSRPSQYEDASVAEIYFRHFSELSALAQEVMASLYRPGIRSLKWPHIQDLMRDFDRRLSRWEAKLAYPFNQQQSAGNAETQCYRGSLVILYHSIRMIINRPSLCRTERQDTAKKSHRPSIPPSGSARGAIEKCVGSARAVVSIIVSRPSNVVFLRSTAWWMLLDHLQRALTVLLLELAFRSEHMPAEAQEILTEARKAVNWLRASGENNDSARQMWQTMSRLLVKAAQRVGGSTSDMIISPVEPPTHAASRSMKLEGMGRESMSNRGQHSNPLVQRAPDYRFPAHPNMWPLSDNQGGDFEMNQNLDLLDRPPYFSQLDAFDQFSYIPGASQAELFPSAGQMGHLAFDTQQGDQQMMTGENDEDINYRMGDWFDFQGRQGL